MKNQTTNLTTTLLLVLLTYGYSSYAQKTDQPQSKDLPTKVFKFDDTKAIPEEFGRVNLFMTGDTNTYGLKDITSGILSIFPASEAHPPHQHVEEEFLVITKGSGIWHINGKEIKAETGDLLYAAPWEMHGIYNSDTVNLEFYFIKWNNKGVPLPMQEAKE